VIREVLPYFVDELSKIAVQLTKKEKGKLYAQYAGLGAISYPAVIALANRIEKGHFIPPTSTKSKWLAANVFKGIVGGAAIPAARLHLIRRTEDKARERIRQAEARKQKTP